MKTSDFSELCKFIFGGEWVTPLSAAVGVNRRTAQRWASGEYPPPDGVIAEVIDLAAAKQLERVTEVLEMMGNRHGLPAEITLRAAGCDSKVASMHPRPWTEATDRVIQERLAALLREAGIQARVDF